MGTALPVGDSHCPRGGSSFSAANGTFYACNGATGGGGLGTSYQERALDRVPLAFDFHDVISLTVPSGAPSADYLVTARIGVHLAPISEPTGQGGTAACTLLDGNALLDEDQVAVSLSREVLVPEPPGTGFVAGITDASMTLVGRNGLAPGSVLHVQCRGLVSATATATASLTVIKAG